MVIKADAMTRSVRRPGRTCWLNSSRQTTGIKDGNELEVSMMGVTVMMAVAGPALAAAAMLASRGTTAVG